MSSAHNAMLRRSLHKVAVGLVLMAVAARWWHEAPGGTGTRAVVTVAARICPSKPLAGNSPTIADGAHALDLSVLRRGLDALGVGRTRCIMHGRA